MCNLEGLAARGNVVKVFADESAFPITSMVLPGGVAIRGEVGRMYTSPHAGCGTFELTPGLEGSGVIRWPELEGSGARCGGSDYCAGAGGLRGCQ